MPHNNLTIDFNDASFDEASSDVQPITNANIDVVFPISDNPSFGLRADNRTGSESSVGVGTGTASAIALMPDAAASSVMDEFLFEFENDIDPADANKNDQGLKITTSGGVNNVIREINITGSFEDLHNGGTLDVHVHKGDVDHDSNPNTPKVPHFDKFSLGAPTANSGNDVALLVSGDTNGADMGDGNDMAMINVDATADMTGTYKGGAGIDVLTLVEGVVQDNGALVDFTQGIQNSGVTDVNSALVTNYGGVGSGLNFFMSEFETLQLTNNADTIIIGSQTGHGLTTAYDASYNMSIGKSNSMLEIKSGYTDGGSADVMYINANSNIYLSFDFADATDTGIDAVFKANGNVTVDDLGGHGDEIDVNITKTGGTILLITGILIASNQIQIISYYILTTFPFLTSLG